MGLHQIGNAKSRHTICQKYPKDLTLAKKSHSHPPELPFPPLYLPKLDRLVISKAKPFRTTPCPCRALNSKERKK